MIDKTTSTGQGAIRFYAGLRTRLILLACLVLVPVCVLIGELALHYYNFVTSETYQRIGTMVRLMVKEQERHVGEARHVLTALAGMPAIRNGAGDVCAILNDTLKLQPTAHMHLGLVGADGRIVCDDHFRHALPNLANREWFQRSLKLPEFSIGAYEIDRESGRALATVVLPMRSETGRPQGAIYAVLDLASMNHLDPLAVLPSRSMMLMFDRAGRVLERNPDPYQWVGRQQYGVRFVKEIMSRGSSGMLEMPALDGIKRLLAFEALASQNGPVYLVVGMPSQLAFSRLYSDFLSVGLGIALAVAATFAIVWFAGDKLFVGRIRRLAEAARRFGEGDRAARSDLPYLPDEIGELAHAFDTMADSIKQRERQLQQYAFAMDQHAIVSITDAAGDITYVNDKFCEATGYTRDELMGKNHRILKSSFSSAQVVQDMWDTIMHGHVWHGTVCNRNKHGGHFWVASTITPFMDDNGLPVQYIAIRTDITDMIAMKDALQRSEEKYRLLAENARDVVALHDRDGRLVYVSPSSTAMLGYGHEELLAMDPCSLAHPSDLEMARMALQTIMAGAKGTSAVIRVRRKSGDYIWGEVTLSPVFGPDRQLLHVQSTLRNVTQRKTAEDSLRLRDKALQASPSGIILFSMAQDNPVIYANPAFEALIGYSARGAVGQDMWVLARQIVSGSDLEKIRAAISGQRDGHMVIPLTRRDGVLRWVDCSVAPVRDEKGDVTHFVAAFNDMTERMLMVEELMHAKEISEQASLAKSEFLSRMTHELRTPLNFILGFAQLLEAQPGQLTATQLDGVQRIIKSGWHLRELIDEVLDLSRIEAGKLDVRLEIVDLTDILKECIGIVELTAADRKIAICECQDNGARLRVRADRMRLKQVLLNLLSNAVKFNHEGGTVSIAQTVTAAGQARITISDTGPGIPINRQGELFKPFSRLDADRAEIPGTGIGLAVSHRFIQLMDGCIGVESGLGKGSAFWIELPCAEHVGPLSI